MLGLEFKLDGLYFTTFRKPITTSLILSYTIPPYTTLRGLLANALGMRRDDYSIQDWVKIGINPLETLNKSGEIAKILKLKGTGKTHKRVFPSSPMFKEFLVSPTYKIYLTGETDKIELIYNALLQPVRPLYIGASDDLADIEPSKPTEVREVTTKQVSGLIGGIHEECSVENVPYKFIRRGKDFSIEYKTVSIPPTTTITLKEDIDCWEFDGVNVWLA